ncbi:BglG family transcriptional antiterminator [Scopulibacillus darangshiensis]|uniref:BglG family transcriptional antiterminator n=1 Tax=Scopulibacillus darangshiensis TaxID=442528 RepID=A0A4R2P2A7_9BACL|nr:transcription antiterminator [Scopulibacillus darangshiensis]TCP28752.1 BglG family transcriptional antiterminator [Scopulibacillus darangshiensis]
MKWADVMYITGREKAILELVIKTSGKHTPLSIATFLHVSVRTIHRDLKNAEKILDGFDLQLNKSEDNGLVITGSDGDIFRLIQHLVKIKPTDISIEQRKLLLLIRLLDEEEPVKLIALAHELNVSVTTLGTYLDDLTDWLNNFAVQLLRKRGVGVEIIAPESAKRKALGSYFLMYFNEELIENLFLFSDDAMPSDDLILSYFKQRYLQVIDKVVNAKIVSAHSNLADSDYVGFLVQVCISLQRIEKGFSLLPDEVALDYLVDTGNYRLVEEMAADFSEKLNIAMEKPDIGFLALYLKGSKLQRAEEAYYDSVITGRALKRVIQHVSLQLNVDLTSDFSLFQGLIAHMEPSIFRIRQKLGSYNPLTEEIKKSYPVLFMAVSNSLEKEFKDISFPDDEIAYIVLHFGSALELRKEDISIKALVVCPTGIGASKMLASRIKKEVGEIKSIDISSIKEMQKLNMESYDIVISTVRLPFANIDYVYVNPLLSEKDIEAIHDYLGTNLRDLTRKGHFKINNGMTNKLTAYPVNVMPLEQFMDDVDDVQSSIRSVLDHLHVYHTRNGEDYRSLLTSMVSICFNWGLVTDAETVVMQLLAREAQGGLGIPGTSMALFHCRHKAVKDMLFHIAHLEKPYMLKGMDGEQMEVRNMLLILAPEYLNPIQLEIVSLISTIIVEDDETLMIFSSANEKMIRKKLEEAFFNFLQNKFKKE